MRAIAMERSKEHRYRRAILYGLAGVAYLTALGGTMYLAEQEYRASKQNCIERGIINNKGEPGPSYQLGLNYECERFNPRNRSDVPLFISW